MRTMSMACSIFAQMAHWDDMPHTAAREKARLAHPEASEVSAYVFAPSSGRGSVWNMVVHCTG
jgi:hypothetical protein